MLWDAFKDYSHGIQRDSHKVSQLSLTEPRPIFSTLAEKSKESFEHTIWSYGVKAMFQLQIDCFAIKTSIIKKFLQNNNVDKV